MLLSARALLTGVALATLSLPVLLPNRGPADADSRNRCVAERNDAIVMHESLPKAAWRGDDRPRKAVVRVAVSRDGLVRRVHLAQSSGDAAFDAAAVRATTETAFAPAARSCVAIDSSFDYALTATALGRVVATVVPGSEDIIARNR